MHVMLYIHVIMLFRHVYYIYVPVFIDTIGVLLMSKNKRFTLKSRIIKINGTNKYFIVTLYIICSNTCPFVYEGKFNYLSN